MRSNMARKAIVEALVATGSPWVTGVPIQSQTRNARLKPVICAAANGAMASQYCLLEKAWVLSEPGAASTISVGSPPPLRLPRKRSRSYMPANPSIRS